MKKKYSIFIIILLIPVFLYALSDQNINISIFSEFPLHFNEQFDPVSDSPFNFLDGDKKTTGVYSDFSLDFDKPVIIDEIKILNGVVADKSLSDKFNRIRDIEITLYTSAEPVEKKEEQTSSKKKNKKIKNQKDKTDKKIQDKKPAGEEKKKEPDKTKSSDDITACIIPVKGFLKPVLAEEPVPDFLKQDVPASQKKDDEKKNDLLNDDSAVERLTIPSKDILKELEKNKTTDKDTLKEKKIKTSVNKKTKSKKEKSKSSSKEKPVKKEKADNKTKPVKKNKEDKKSITSGTKHKEEKNKGDVSKKELSIEPLKKITGIIKPENDSQGRVLVFVSLKDSREPQSIKLKKRYALRRIEFRVRDDGYYKGSIYDSVLISDISFFNKGKQIFWGNIAELKKSYIEKYTHMLEKSISGEIFSAFQDGKEVTRMSFRKDGRIEIRDRYACNKKGDPDCTSSVFPHRWKIENGRLFMMYGRDWLSWKFQLDSAGNLMDEKSSFNSPRWIKLYYRNGNTFSDNYLYLQRSEEREWRWEN